MAQVDNGFEGVAEDDENGLVAVGFMAPLEGENDPRIGIYGAFVFY